MKTFYRVHPFLTVGVYHEVDGLSGSLGQGEHYNPAFVKGFKVFLLEQFFDFGPYAGRQRTQSSEESAVRLVPQGSDKFEQQPFLLQGVA
jgi:hypothetical protein